MMRAPATTLPSSPVICAMCATRNESIGGACSACGLPLSIVEQAALRERIDGSFVLPAPTPIIEEMEIATPPSMTPVIVHDDPSSLGALVTQLPAEPESDAPSLVPAVQSMPPLERRPRRSPTSLLVSLCVLGGLGIAVEPVLLAWSDRAAAHIPPAPRRTARLVTSDVTGIDQPANEDAALAAPVPPGMGQIKTVGATPRHRIFVDRHVVGQTPATVTVPCGAHTIRLGSAAATMGINVPCGGVVEVSENDPSSGP